MIPVEVKYIHTRLDEGIIDADIISRVVSEFRNIAESLPKGQRLEKPNITLGCQLGVPLLYATARVLQQT